MSERSVGVLVAEAVERFEEVFYAEFSQDAPRPLYDALTALGFPALVEALSDLLSYAENATTDWRNADDETAWRANIDRAREVLGGVRVSGRADADQLKRERDDAVAALIVERETVTEALAEWERMESPLLGVADHVARRLGATGTHYDLQGVTNALRLHDELVRGRAELEAELGDLRAIGDRMQSEAARLATAVERVPLPYEARMAEAEIKSAVKDWTAARAAVDGETTTTKGSE